MVLPGIDLNHADVYQTSDLPEADQHYQSLEDESNNDSVETIRISSSEAFGRFKGSYLDNKNVDFSDRLRNSRRKGYIVWKGVEEEKKEETPVQKYQRLNCEIRDLLDEVGEAKTKKDSGLMPDTLESLYGQVEALHKYLMEMRLEEIIGKEKIAIMTDPQEALKKKLLCQLEELKLVDGAKSDDKSKDKNTESVKYELLMKPDVGKLQESSDLIKLSSRIQSIEKALDASDEHMEIIYTETGKKSLTDAISVLSAKTALLEPNNLDHIEGRIAILQQKLAKLQDSESQQPEDEDPDLPAKIQSLHTTVERTNTGLAQIPDLMDRMEALSPLHTQATEATQSLLELETIQQQIQSKLRNNTRLLKEVQEKFSSNLQSINENFDSLNQRIEKLQK